jgi:small subunit ribosomal protein S16
MPRKIRLRRMGRKKAPHYRIVIAESSMPREGRFVATIGHYNPTTQPETLEVDHDKAAAWMAKGAVPTDTVRSLLLRAAAQPETVVDTVKGAAATAGRAVKGAAGKAADVAGKTPIAQAASRARIAPVSEAQRQRTAVRADFVRRAFASDAAMARALNVDRSRISRWRKGEGTDAGVVERLVAVDTAIELLTGFLDDRSIPKWLSGTNAHLGDRRPIDVLTQGRLSEVVAAIEAEKSGAYA